MKSRTDINKQQYLPSIRSSIPFSPLTLSARSSATNKQMSFFFFSPNKYLYAAGKMSIEHVTVFLSKCISEDAIDMKCSPDAEKDPHNPHMERN